MSLCNESDDDYNNGRSRNKDDLDIDVKDLVLESTDDLESKELELASRLVQIQSKRFYMDIKENQGGTFLKVAEVSANGRRSHLFFQMSAAVAFRNYLQRVVDFNSKLDTATVDAEAEEGKLMSEVILREHRRYFLDFMENKRGRFLRVSQTSRRGPRSRIAIPALGLESFHVALASLLKDYEVTEEEQEPNVPEGQHVRIDNKTFHFDVLHNNRGTFMRISEVNAKYRTSISVPDTCWSRFRDIFNGYIDQMENTAPNAPENGGDSEEAKPESCPVDPGHAD